MRNFLISRVIKLSFPVILFICNTLQAEVKIEYLSGDTRSACEALICLASPVKPPECASAIARYFAIKFKKPWETLQARKNFLNLCPTNNKDLNLKNYKTGIFAFVDLECTIPSLNARVETKRDAFKKTICHYDVDGEQVCRVVDKIGFRINPNLTNSCKLLASSHYSDYRLKYTCNNKFYTKEEWESGKEIIGEISKAEFDNLPVGKKLSLSKWEMNKRNKHKFFNNYISYSLVSKYYKTQTINKSCWINQNK